MKTKLLSAAALSAGMLLSMASADAAPRRRARGQTQTARRTDGDRARPADGPTCTLVSRKQGNGGKGSYRAETVQVCEETGMPPAPKAETAQAETANK